MALRDYILCKKCECKLIYDGGDSAREWLEERWGAPDASMWTKLLLCPDCIKALEAERDQLQDKLADAEGSMLRRFDPAAAESTDLFTWITCMLAERDRLKNLVAMAELAIGEHYAPSDCYSTGPLTGGIADHLCPACAFIAVLAAKE